MELIYKHNFIAALKTSISAVQLLDTSVTNFYGLIENLVTMTVNALHQVDYVEAVKGGVFLASNILKSCDSAQVFTAAYEKLSKGLREVVELNIANFKADMLTMKS